SNSSLSIAPSPLTRGRNAESSNGAQFLPEIVHPDLPSTRSAAAHVPAKAGSTLLPKGRIAGQVIALICSSAAHLFHVRSGRRRSSIKTLIAAPWSYWRNEFEVRRTTRALAELDDHTLRDLGIPERSQIEFTVRFCREC